MMSTLYFPRPPRNTYVVLENVGCARTDEIEGHNMSGRVGGGGALMLTYICFAVQFPLSWRCWFSIRRSTTNVSNTLLQHF